MYTYYEKNEKHLSILNYDHTVTYLTDIYSFERKQNNRFSYDIWAQYLGIKSRSYLRLVCTGKRPVSDWFIDIFAMIYGFSAAEKKHFQVIAKHSNSETDLEKQIFKNALLEKHEVNHEDLTENVADYIKNPLLVKLQTLSGFKDVELTLKKLSALTDETVTVLEKSLLQLEDLGLIERHQNTEGEIYWRSSIKPVRIQNTPFSQKAVATYHKLTLKEASQQVEKHDDASTFRGVLFSLNRNKFPEIKEDVEDFIRKIKAKYGSEEIKNKDLFQLNLQLYPLTSSESKP